jgi:formylglycine-generating enzyme
MLPSLLEIVLLASPLLLAKPQETPAPGGPATSRATAGAKGRVLASGYVPPDDPGPSPYCPGDMRLITGRHFEDVEHLCIDFRPSARRCWAYHAEYTLAQGEPEDMRFCMDQFEAPNERGARPIVMKTFVEAERWCQAKNKRVCAESEWETACESGDERPWFYGWKLDDRVCNTSKQWKQFNATVLMNGGEEAQKEVERLWQGARSGEFAACRTNGGIHDMMGNVEEWVASSRKRRFKAALMGGFWAKPWVGCRGTNDAHEPTFRFYEVGFRCCSAAAPSAQGNPGDGAPAGDGGAGVGAGGAGG